MRSGRGQPHGAVPGDPRLARYRQATAEVFDDFLLVGHLSTRVVWVWRRHPTRPVELLEWSVTPMPAGAPGRIIAGTGTPPNMSGQGVLFDSTPSSATGSWVGGYGGQECSD
jgi:hypothetical protein